MKTILACCLFIAACLAGHAQEDTTAAKLRVYKGYYTQGLIDSQEYAMLKAKLLGIEPKYVVIEQPRKKKTIDSVLYYDLTKPEKILPAGLYMSMEEIKARRPSLKCPVIVKARNNYDYQNGVGGNVMIINDGECISKNKLKLDVWIYSTGVKCYANLDHFKMQPFYNPIITMGRFLAFYKNETNETFEAASNWGGYIAAEIAMATGHDYKKLYVIDVNAAMLEPVTDEYMEKVLIDFPALYKRYMAEPSKSTVVWAKYLQEANELSPK